MSDTGSKQSTMSNPARKRLETLVGKWNLEIVHPMEPSNVIGGWATFEWLEGGFFLIERSEISRSEFPKSVAIIGCDDSLESYSMLYSDSRDVARLYQMSLNDEGWKLWRDDPKFRQRFVGKFSDDGNTIKGYWETSRDGSTWEHDFDITYIKQASNA